MFSQMDSKVQNIVSEILNDVNCQCNQSNTECELLDREAIVRVIEELETVLFPAHFSSKKAIGNFALRYELGGLMANIYTTLSEQIAKSLPYDENFKGKSKEACQEHAEAQTAVFLDRLTTIREYLKTDIQAAYDGDPAHWNGIHGSAEALHLPG